MSESIQDRINATLDAMDGVNATENTDAQGSGQDSGQGDGGQQQQEHAAAGTPANGQPGPQHADGRQPAQPKEQQVRPGAPNDRGVVDQAQREHLSRTQRAVQRETQELRRQLETSQRDLQTFREAAQLPTQLGLNPQDTTTALQFMAHWRRDPVGAARGMLTELRAAGYDLPDLAGGVDVGAIQRMIRQEIAPFQQDRAHQRAELETQQQVQTEIANLYADMPWARTQQTELAALLDADSSLSLREAAYQLQIWAMQRGYDLSQPLQPQHLAVVNGQQQQPQQPQRPNVARAPGPVASNGNGALTERQGSSMDATMRTRDIVRAAMREQGIQV